MCGLAGSLNWNNKPDRNLVKRMNSVLGHRGPDAKGIVELENLIIGHRRLSIIDPFSKSDQPMSDDTKNVISFNGEIYNFREIKQLQEGGAVFRTESDTEVILAAYQKWNLGCFQQFTGMFAIALWDYKNKSLILARDRFGEKPLFYYMGKDNELFCFRNQSSPYITSTWFGFKY